MCGLNGLFLGHLNTKKQTLWKFDTRYFEILKQVAIIMLYDLVRNRDFGSICGRIRKKNKNEFFKKNGCIRNNTFKTKTGKHPIFGANNAIIVEQIPLFKVKYRIW